MLEYMNFCLAIKIFVWHYDMAIKMWISRVFLMKLFCALWTKTFIEFLLACVPCVGEQV